MKYPKFIYEVDYSLPEELDKAEVLNRFQLNQDFRFHLPITKANDVPTIDELFELVNQDRFVIEGLASTPDIDRQDDIIEPKALEAALDGWKINPILLYQHDTDAPIGKVLKWKITEEGLEIQAYISQTARFVRVLIAEGILRTFSVGGRILEAEQRKVKDRLVRVITKLELYEISVVSLPSNRRAAFDLVRAIQKGDDTYEIKECTNCKDKLPREDIVKSKTEDLEADAEPDITRPYPSEHSCRLRNPKQFDYCRRGQRAHNGKPYSVIFCKKGDGPMVEQAYRYNKKIWEASEAESHCKAHGGSFEAAKSEEEIFATWDSDSNQFSIFEDLIETKNNNEVVEAMKRDEKEKEIREEAKDEESPKEEAKEEVKEKEVEEKIDYAEFIKSALSEATKPLLEKIEALEKEIAERTRPKEKKSFVEKDYDKRAISDFRDSIISIVERWKAGERLSAAEKQVLETMTKRAFENLPTANLNDWNFLG